MLYIWSNVFNLLLLELKLEFLFQIKILEPTGLKLTKL